MKTSELRNEMIVEIEKLIDRHDAATQVVSTKQNDDAEWIRMQSLGREAIKHVAVSIIQAIICKPPVHPAMWHGGRCCDRIPQQHNVGSS